MIISNNGAFINGLWGAYVDGKLIRFKDDDCADICIEITTLIRLLDIVKHVHKNNYEHFIKSLFEKEKENDSI